MKSADSKEHTCLKVLLAALKFAMSAEDKYFKNGSRWSLSSRNCSNLDSITKRFFAVSGELMDSYLETNWKLMQSSREVGNSMARVEQLLKQLDQFKEELVSLRTDNTRLRKLNVSLHAELETAKRELHTKKR